MTILCLHTVDPNWRSSLALDPGEFARFCGWLVEHRTVVPLEQALRQLDRSGRLPRGVVVLTFDDGFASLYDHAWPILQRHRLPATIFLVAKTLAPGGHVVDWVDPAPEQPPATLAPDQVLEMQAAGLRFESHSYSHRVLPSLTEEECRRELSDSRGLLSDLLGRDVDLLAYPRGCHDARVQQAARLAGYRHAFSLPETAEAPTAYAIPRVGLYPGNGIAALRIKTSRWYLPVRTSRTYQRLRRRIPTPAHPSSHPEAGA